MKRHPLSKHCRSRACAVSPTQANKARRIAFFIILSVLFVIGMLMLLNVAFYIGEGGIADGELIIMGKQATIAW